LIQEEGEKSLPLVSSVEHPGHRGDVRVVALSSDETTLASCDNASLKIWSLKLGEPVCTSTQQSGFGLCADFAPGNRHVFSSSVFLLNFQIFIR